MEEDFAAIGDVAFSPSPPLAAHSPRSESTPLWTPAQEQAALDAYNCALADNYIYDLMRLFASAVRALGMFDCHACLEELDQLPEVHQRSSTVMAMVGRARYEMADYMKASGLHLFPPMFVANLRVPPRRNDSFTLLGLWTRIAFGIWKSILLLFGICNGMCNCLSLLRSC